MKNLEGFKRRMYCGGNMKGVVLQTCWVLHRVTLVICSSSSCCCCCCDIKQTGRYLADVDFSRRFDSICNVQIVPVVPVKKKYVLLVL